MQILCLIIIIILVPEIFIFAGRFILKFAGWLLAYLVLGFGGLFLAGTVIKYSHSMIYVGIFLGIGLFIEGASGWPLSRFLRTKISPGSGLKPKDAYEQWCAKVMR